MSNIDQQRMLSGVSDLSKLTSNKRTKLAKLFREYNTDITSYSKDVLNSKETQAKDLRLEDNEIYSALHQHQKLLSQRFKNKNYKNLDDTKRGEYLNYMASRPEIKEVLTKMCNELIVTHENSSRFAEPKLKDLELKELGFDEKLIEKISENIKINFNDFYKKLGFSRDGAWNNMYEFLKKGKKAYEIIYDNPMNPKRIKNIIEIEPTSLEMIYRDGDRYWIHTPPQVNGFGMANIEIGNTNNKIILYDHQIIYIDWNSDMVDSEHVSYLEQLIKPYNFMRIIDETRIIWAVTNATFRTLYSVPTTSQGRNRSEQTVSSFTEMYKDHYNFDNYSGDVSVNGENNLMFAKDHFMSKGDAGDPEISVIGGEGAELQTIEPNEMFQKKFYRSSGIPYGRFDSTSNETWNLDPTSVYREEIDFNALVRKIRETFSKIILKPVLYQLVLDMPELHDEPDIPDNIILEYSAYSIFGRMMEQDMLKAQFEFVEQMRNSAQMEMADGTMVSMLPLEYILKKYLGYDDEELKLIEELRYKEIDDKLKMEKKIKDIKDKYGIADEFEEEEDL